MSQTETRLLPSFDDLPFTNGSPDNSDWGLWGDGDEVGTINLLTPERVLAASQLIRTGKTFPLNWKLELPNPPLFHRERLSHTIKNKRPFVNDDVYNDFNTQSSTHWDGLTHMGSAQCQCFYGQVTQPEITGQPGTRNGIQAWARRGIAGRAVLLDYERWAGQRGIHHIAGERVEITADELRQVAEAQGTRFETGDVLIVRTGWTAWYDALDESQRADVADGPHTFIGVAQGPETLRFLWDNHFAAVAGDAPSFEAWPPDPDRVSLHMTLLPLWGMPIGEMFYLEDLAVDCAADGQYEFMLTSAPLNKLGGVASPANALALK
jgi:kynurenine formamidase